jgi:hypothetical protein
MSLLTAYRAAAQASGRSLPALLLEALQLRLHRAGAGHGLGLSEYLDFQLYLNDLSPEAKREFCGFRGQDALEQVLIDDTSRLISLDKFTMYAVLSAYGLPIPALRASYGTARPRGFGPLRSLTTPAELEAFLREPGQLPLYVKPSYGAYGRGNVLIQALDGDQLLLGSGERVAVAAFVASLDVNRTLGWVLQQPLTPHPAVEQLTGSPKISGLRVHSFLTPRGPVLTRAMFKINAGLRDSDNFEHGASGNLLAAVDLDTGRLTRVVAGTGANQQRNPVLARTGQTIEGATVPDWPAVVNLVLEAHRAVPGYLMPGWDIALCGDGPRILEVNAFGDVDLTQHAHRRGFLDAALRALLRERGLEELVLSGAGASEVSPRNHRRGRRKHHWPW